MICRDWDCPGKRDKQFHSGEGAVSAISWNGNLVVWANEQGVRVSEQSDTMSCRAISEFQAK